jgi:hypothetical protein
MNAVAEKFEIADLMGREPIDRNFAGPMQIIATQEPTYELEMFIMIRAGEHLENKIGDRRNREE